MRSYFAGILAILMTLILSDSATAIPRVEFLTARALKLEKALNNNDLAEINGQLDDRVKRVMPARSLVAAWRRIISVNGPVKKKGNPRVESMGGYKLVYIPIKFEKSYLDLKLTYSLDGKLSGFFIVKHKKGYESPSYSNPEKFKEVPVRFGLEKWKLWGKLCIPMEGKSPYPVCVLVHGSGPQDMDESIGSNKPFLDIAHGLASKGVATLRYTKRTKEYKLNSEQIQSMTIQDETIDDAKEAVKFLKTRKEIDKNRIFLLGHSMGGMLIPRIEKQEGSIAGFISLAGESLPMHKKIVDQTKYLAQGGGEVAKKQIKAVEAQSQEIQDVASGKKNVGNKLIMGASANYWKDLAKYKPLESVKHMKRPVLFLQGGRDYQVTAKDDFALWKRATTGIGEKDQFQFKLYPSLNHLFMSGSGRSMPSEYINKSANVDPKVVSDIASWILTL